MAMLELPGAHQTLVVGTVEGAMNGSVGRKAGHGIRVVLCDDHALIRRGVRETLNEAAGFDVVAEVASVPALRRLLPRTPCDVLLIDLSLLPGQGAFDLNDTLGVGPSLRVLVLSMLPEDPHAIRSLRAGAQGFLAKRAEPAELLAAVSTVARGRKYVSTEVAQMLADGVAAPPSQAPHEALSERELQTLVGIASGKRLSEIAEELTLSPKTISAYRTRVLDKLRLESNAALAVYATRHHLA